MHISLELSQIVTAVVECSRHKVLICCGWIARGVCCPVTLLLWRIVQMYAHWATMVKGTKPLETRIQWRKVERVGIFAFQIRRVVVIRVLLFLTKTYQDLFYMRCLQLGDDGKTARCTLFDTESKPHHCLIRSATSGRTCEPCSKDCNRCDNREFCASSTFVLSKLWAQHVQFSLFHYK